MNKISSDMPSFLIYQSPGMFSVPRTYNNTILNGGKKSSFRSQRVLKIVCKVQKHISLIAVKIGCVNIDFNISNTQYLPLPLRLLLF